MKLAAVSYKRKWLIAALSYICFCILYTFTGRVHLRGPASLTAWGVDEAVPFIGWTVWIYHSQFLFLFLCILALKNTIAISRVLYSMGMASALSFFVFLIYPTTLPRSSPTTDKATAIAFDLLYSMDPASNCFPSLHVSLAGLAALGVASDRKRAAPFAIIWAVIIMLSTMTTKQHYFVDVIAGLVVLLFCRALARKITFEPCELNPQNTRIGEGYEH